ncbi:MAG: class I SAM-dependent methyltransferase [Hyphomonas sp.]
MNTMQELEAEFAAEKWFHAIDFGDFASSGRSKPGVPPNRTLFGFMDMIQHIDLKGMDVLDIGATDGLASFGMAALGARVRATDTVDRKTFRRAREILDHPVEYHPTAQIKDFHRLFAPGTFDFILCAGVFYHMINPASSIFECRKILKDNGLLMIETPFYPNEDRAAIFINSETETVFEANTYSVPTKSAVTGLMKLAGFEILAVREAAPLNRVTVLGQARNPDQVSDRTPLLQRIHEVDLCDREFRFKDEPPKTRSAISYTGPFGEQKLDTSTYQPNFPYQPSVTKRTVGSTIWSTPEGNR